MKIDKLDRKILAIISDNARIPFRDVAERCGVSRAAIHQHVQRMVERGVITGSGYRVNPKDLGYTTCTYIGVRLERAALYREVLPQIQAIPEVVECHYTTGPYSMLIKLYAVDNSHLMHILSDRIQSITGVSSTETLISLAEGFVRNMPIPEEDTAESYTIYSAE
ncbi:MAG: Lrp/AsnC ligand binding domain-containing protein [Bacteroidales bacterium]|nr:Lrp/AsnC ligand binding domain-containing protein [Porphyromonas sp.]MDD6934896.1 Lrp/AsnC ligand binding domain-containing protein [Bacteroidales bacterium]MDY3102450.1 Lrp/AsnC ligand binding domain-containing protein [Porphyromonas sp.]